MSKKIIGVAAIVMFLIFTPIAVLATDTKEDAIQIIKTEEEKYIVYEKIYKRRNLIMQYQIHQQ